MILVFYSRYMQSGYQCFYSLVSKSKEKIRCLIDSENTLIKADFFGVRKGALIRPEGEAKVPVYTWVWSKAFEHPRYIFPQNPPHNSKDNIPTFE